MTIDPNIPRVFYTPSGRCVEIPHGEDLLELHSQLSAHIVLVMNQESVSELYAKVIVYQEGTEMYHLRRARGLMIAATKP